MVSSERLHAGFFNFVLNLLQLEISKILRFALKISGFCVETSFVSNKLLICKRTVMFCFCKVLIFNFRAKELLVHLVQSDYFFCRLQYLHQLCYTAKKKSLVDSIHSHIYINTIFAVEKSILHKTIAINSVFE